MTPSEQKSPSHESPSEQKTVPGPKSGSRQKPASLAEPGREERRSGAPDRRDGQQDRRNPERLMDDIAPRRNPEVPDRRKG